MNSWVHKISRYGQFAIAILISALVLAIRMTVQPIMHETGPFYLSAIAVTVAAFFGGLWPGLLAGTITTGAGILLFVRSPETFAMSAQLRLLVASQVLSGICISLICESLRTSERKAARTAAPERSARSKLDAIFYSITDKLLIISPEMILLDYNQAASVQWAIQKSAVGESLLDGLPNANFGPLITTLQVAMSENRPTSFEYQDPAGSHPYEVRVFPNKDGALVYFHNISERMESARQLADLATEQGKVSAYLDSLLSHAPVGFGFFDRQYRFLRVNSALSEIHGVPVADHVGRTIREVVPLNAHFSEPIVAQVFTTGQPVGNTIFSGEASSKPGVTRHWHCSFYPVVSEEGTVSAVGGVFFEISDRVAMEDQLRISEQRFRSLADNSPVLTWLCDPDGTANWLSKAWLDFRGLSLEDAVGEGCFSALYPEDAERVFNLRDAALSAAQPVTLEFRTASASGEYRWIHAVGNPVFSADGKFLNYLFSCIDVTERFQMEESLRLSLANERQARSEAEDANRLKDEFLASLSHELRTPLTTIVGWTELMSLKTAKQSDIADGIEAITKSSRLQLQLISNLLDMNGVSTGEISLELEYVELVDFVQGTLDMNLDAANAQAIKLQMIAPNEPIIVRIDTDRFMQILSNLLSNALKFTPVGGSITAKIESTGPSASVQIIDTGIGIQSSFLPHVFERFRQADAGRSRRYGGPGVGLAIAKQLTELHGGQLAVFSEGLDCGSTFEITLPVAEDAPFSGRINLNSDPTSEAILGRLGEISILLVEDDDSSRQVLAKILQSAGAKVFLAESADAARKLLASETPTLIISDIAMAEEDGVEFLSKLRHEVADASQQIPAIALTAFASADDRSRAYEAGFNAFFSKPVKTETLIQAILDLVRV